MLYFMNSYSMIFFRLQLSPPKLLGKEFLVIFSKNNGQILPLQHHYVVQSMNLEIHKYDYHPVDELGIN